MFLENLSLAPRVLYSQTKLNQEKQKTNMVGVSFFADCYQAPPVSLISESEVLMVPLLKDEVSHVEAGDCSGFHDIKGVMLIYHLAVVVQDHRDKLHDHRGVADSLSYI